MQYIDIFVGLSPQSLSEPACFVDVRNAAILNVQTFEKEMVYFTEIPPGPT